MAGTEAEVLNPGDDVRNDVAAAIQQLKGEAPEAPADAAPEVAPEVEAEAPVKGDHPTDPARYADGTFKSKTEPAPVEAAPVETKSPPLDTTKASTPQPSTAVGAPPVSWAADAKQTWNALPPAVQAAVLKRESEVSSGFKQKSDEVRRYEGTLAPLVQETQRLGISPEQGLNALLEAHRKLSQDPASAIAQLAQQYGIDLAALASNPPAPQPQRVDPAVPQLHHQLSTLQARLDGFLSNQTLGVVESFAKSPDHPHYADVESDLLRIIPLVQQSEPGLSPTEVLQKAYDQAVWLNPDVRQKLLAEQAEKTANERLQALQTKQTKATKAAVSIKGSSSGVMPPPKQANGSGDVYDDVRAAINQLRQ